MEIAILLPILAFIALAPGLPVVLPGTGPIVARTRELERAQRALEMVEHGTTMLAAARRGPRELEAQTSIKRGYLNLIHAREAFARHALEAQEFQLDSSAQKAGRSVEG